MKHKIEIRYIESGDKELWKSMDKHLSDAELDKKIRDKQGYVLTVKERVVGILRYNLFWDNTPFCSLLFIQEKYRGCGYGKAMMQFWENYMRASGYNWLLVSTRADENAQHFYRKLGYTDCGSLLAPDQPTELFLSKTV